MRYPAHFLPFLAAVFAAGCGGGVSVLPEPFTRERADGKIPVKAELIRQQVRAELDGMPEGEAEVARWQEIETDYNRCRLSSARATSKEAEEVFAVCMSEKGYVYMYPVDAEQFHNDIAFEEPKIYAAEKKAAEERRIAAEKKAEEKRIADRFKQRIAAAIKAEKKERVAAERKAEAERISAENQEQYRLANNLIKHAKTGNLSEVRRLLADGVNPNVATKYGETALMVAADKGHAEMVKILLDGGANPNQARKNKNVALGYAILNGHAKIVRILLDYGANPNAVVGLKFAVREGYVNIVEMLLKAGANPNLSSGFDGFSAMDELLLQNRFFFRSNLLWCGCFSGMATIYAT